MTTDILTSAPIRPVPWRLDRALDGLLKRLDGAFSPAIQIVGVIVLVAVCTIIAALLYNAFAMTRLSMFFLGSVILSALAFGTRASVFAAFLSFIAYNFTLTEPRFAFQFAGAEDILTLSVFLVVALTTGALAGRVRESQRRERARAEDLSLLLDASQAHARTDDPTLILAQLSERLSQVSGGAAWVVGPDAPAPLHAIDPHETALDELLAAAVSGDAVRRSGVWRARRIERLEGSDVAVWRTHPVAAATEDRLAEILIDLAAASLDRARLSQARTRAEADRQAGALREAVLASLSHDLRTPLASILASASSLRDFDDRFDAPTRHGLSDGIVHEADRLNRYVDNLLSLTRIQAGSLAPTLAPTGLADVLEQAVRRLERQDSLNLTGVSDLRDMTVMADPLLLEQVLFNILDNAVTHGGPGVTLRVEAGRDADRIYMVLEDDGTGIVGAEPDRLFEKFFQAPASRPDRRGAGVGLAVARGFVEAMGGTISAGARPDGVPGLRLDLSLRAGALNA